MNDKRKIDATSIETMVVAVSSRALFDLDASHAIFEKDGVDAYCRHQVEHEEIGRAHV